ncbi:AraC family transcriptional regulator [Chitinophaga sp. S165]|uniref:AraC family transcriptional regulator n=1 Tax=Chitinophaga sp. S165 TaxID=2135462 RepID=UPI000D7106D0|nr:AraC family transcriptional regulator [Chitinophaga sp. S165]PWV55870.1 AraC-like DNA-binding protein [Chitinophaga sp. S165]
MKAKQLYKAVEVTVMEIDDLAATLHKHHFFQLIYVLEGSGTHTINNNNFEFSQGDVFLLTPGEGHSFTISTPPIFCLIDFTTDFFSRNTHTDGEEVDLSNSFRRLEYIFHNQHALNGNLASPGDKNIFSVLVNQLINETKTSLPFDKIVTQNIIFLLLNLIARNIQQNIIASSKSHNPKNKVHEIITYIQHNIYENQLLRIENLAAHFGMSEGHLSRYFKLQSGDTVKDYIMRYKLEMVLARLKYSDLTISEIADELNFADESHLNKTFKQAYGKTAKQFRKDYLVSVNTGKPKA